jgi:hypothetical protein
MEGKVAGVGGSPSPLGEEGERGRWLFFFYHGSILENMSSKTMFKTRIHDNDACLMRLSNGPHLSQLMWFRNV